MYVFCVSLCIPRMWNKQSKLRAYICWNKRKNLPVTLFLSCGFFTCQVILYIMNESLVLSSTIARLITTNSKQKERQFRSFFCLHNDSVPRNTLNRQFSGPNTLKKLLWSLYWTNLLNIVQLSGTDPFNRLWSVELLPVCCLWFCYDPMARWREENPGK